MSSSNCCFLTCIQVSQEADKVAWYSHLFKNFPQFVVIHTVKGFSVVNEAEVDVFSWNSIAFSMIQWMLPALICFLCLFEIQLEHLEVLGLQTVESYKAHKNRRVEGLAFIFYCENSYIASVCWTTIDSKMLDPTKKDTPLPRAKEKPQQDGRWGKFMFGIKPHIHQRHSEGSNKTLCLPGPRDPTRDWARPTFECISVSCMGQQWPAVGTGTLVAAGLGDAESCIIPLVGVHH